MYVPRYLPKYRCVGMQALLHPACMQLWTCPARPNQASVCRVARSLLTDTVVKVYLQPPRTLDIVVTGLAHSAHNTKHCITLHCIALHCASSYRLHLAFPIQGNKESVPCLISGSHKVNTTRPTDPVDLSTYLRYLPTCCRAGCLNAWVSGIRYQSSITYLRAYLCHAIS